MKVKTKHIADVRVCNNYTKWCLGQLGKESDYNSWGSITATHILGGLPNPIKIPYTQAHIVLDIYLARQLKNYRIEDTPSNQYKPLPLYIVHSMVVAATTSTEPKPCHITDLVQLVF